MKTHWKRGTGATLVVSMGLFLCAMALPAEDKVKKKDVKDTPTGKVLSDTAKEIKKPETTFDGRKHVEPVKPEKPTTKRTPEQAIKEYKDSGRANPGPKTVKLKEPPAPPVEKPKTDKKKDK